MERKQGPRVLLEGGQHLPLPEDCKHYLFLKDKETDTSKADEKFSNEIGSIILISSRMEKYPWC